MTDHVEPVAASPLSRVALAVVAAGLVAALAGLAARSLGWRMNQDAPTLFYGAWLASAHGLVPYRDFFELNAPGAHLAYVAFGALAGHAGGTALRGLDLAWLAALLAAGAALLRPLGRGAILAVVPLGGLLYLGGGDYWSLQREVILLLPALLAHGLAAGPGGGRWLLAGLALGVAGAVKPQALLLGAPLLLGLDGRRARARAVTALALGVALAWAAVAAWLAAQGALGPFLELAREYWPLYNSLTGRPYRAVTGLEHAALAVTGTVGRLDGRYGAWLLLAAIGGGLAWRATEATGRRHLLRLIGLAVAALLLPGVSVKFWSYHWLPFGFAAMLLVAAGAGAISRTRPGAAAVLLGAAAACLPTDGWRCSPRGAPLLARVDAVVGALATRLTDGDTVQPLDRSGTALHAMLLLRARIATRYLEDTVFYHHAARPWIALQRKRFVAELQAAPPRFVIDLDEPGWADHSDSRRPYSALGRLLAVRYRVLARFDGGRVLERRPETGAQP